MCFIRGFAKYIQKNGIVYNFSNCNIISSLTILSLIRDKQINDIFKNIKIIIKYIQISSSIGKIIQFFL